MDARKLKEKATEAFAKGKFAKAAEAYADYCAADPKDLQARLRMGDAWVKAGQKEKAIGAYQFAAEGFAKEGFLPRAIAASKLILELDPSHQGVQKMLAELYARKTGPSGGAARPKTSPGLPAVALGGLGANNKHAPIELPKADEVPAEIEESRSFKNPTVVAKSEEEVPIEVEGPSAKSSEPPAPAAEIELDVSVTGGGVPPLPPPGPPKEPAPPEKIEIATIEMEIGPPPPSRAEATAVEEKRAPPKPREEKPAPMGRDASGAYELDFDDPDDPEDIEPEDDDEEPLAPVEGLAEKSQLQLAEESGRFKRTTSGAYELDLDDAPESEEEEREEPIALTQPTASRAAPPAMTVEAVKVDEPKVVVDFAALGPAAPEPKAAEPAKVDEAKWVAALATPKASAPLTPPPSASASAPPGLKAKRQEPPLRPPEPLSVAVPEPVAPVQASSQSRLWLPNNVTEPAAEQSQARRLSAPLKGGPQTDLERSLAAFSQFDDEVQIIESPRPSPPKAESSQHKRGAHTFTELELEGDSLLHAVEAAANIGLEQRGQQAASPAVEERMEAPEEAKPEPGALPKIPLFSDLPPDAFIALFERCPLRRFEPPDNVIQQGSLGDSFFVICAGSVRVFRTDGEVRRDIATLSEGVFFGEMALLSGAARTASVEAASEDTQLLEISAAILTELSHKYPPVATALKKFCRQRLLTNVMNSSALFAPFTRNERRALVERFRARDVQKGEVVIREGQRSDGMYVVLSGEIEVRLGLRAVASLKEGDIFGEMSLLTKAPATASCAAARRTSLLRLPREDFDQIVLSHPQILVLVSELTDERKKQNAALASRAPKVASEATPMV
jgi:CRP-like cAMP-binding protein